MTTPDVVLCRGERCRCWACPTCGAAMSRALGAKLAERFNGRRAIMVTLTINRANFAGPRDAYDHVKGTRAIPRAVASWASEAGIDVAGMWIAKMELQSGGWPHWHVLIEVPEYLTIREKGSFDEHWRHGFSNVRHRGVSVRYLAKYVAKAMTAEASRGLLDCSGLPPKGVKWITASHGFWGPIEKQPASVIEKPVRGEPATDRDAPALSDRVGVCGRHTQWNVYTGGLLKARVRVPVSVLDSEWLLGDGYSDFRGRRYGCVVVRTTTDAYKTAAEMCGVTDGTDEHDDRLAKLPISLYV